ncbi:MAG: hypothetical protein V4658_09845 [Bacteroidota bacterium]
MKPANFLHMFAIILLISFAVSEHVNLKTNYDMRLYDLRVAKSHVSRYAGKTEGGKAEVARLKQKMADLADEHKFLTGLSGYKAMLILFLFLFVLWQFALYFKIDFEDQEDATPGVNYQRKTWLLNFILFFVLSAWCLYFRQNMVVAVLCYLVAIASLVRSLMLASELRLITKQRGTSAFAAVTIGTSVILYFNLLLIAAVYYTSVFTQTSLVEQLMNLGR